MSDETLRALERQDVGDPETTTRLRQALVRAGRSDPLVTLVDTLRVLMLAHDEHIIGPCPRCGPAFILRWSPTFVDPSAFSASRAVLCRPTAIAMGTMRHVGTISWGQTGQTFRPILVRGFILGITEEWEHRRRSARTWRVNIEGLRVLTFDEAREEGHALGRMSQRPIRQEWYTQVTIENVP